MLVLKWDTTQVPNGKYTVQLSDIDKANNIATIYRKVTVTNKITTPTAVVATITSPTNNATVNGNVTVSGTVVDTNPDFYDLVIRDAGGNVVGGPSVIYAPTVADYDWDTTQLANGVYTIDLVGQDQAGDKGVATEQVTVDNNAVVPSNPIVTPPANANTTNQYQPNREAYLRKHSSKLKYW